MSLYGMQARAGLMAQQAANDYQQQTFMQNLGRFSMFAGLGMMQGIGAGLANTDLKNPFKGPGAALQGGTAVGQKAVEEQMDQEAINERNQMNRKYSEDLLKTYKPMKKQPPKLSEFEGDDDLIMNMATGQPEMRIGVADLSPTAKMFLAQQGVAAKRARSLIFNINDAVMPRD